MKKKRGQNSFFDDDDAFLLPSARLKRRGFTTRTTREWSNARNARMR